jgi:putative ABC transport system permease protein
MLLAQPFMTVVARYAARFSVRALDVAVDGTLLWVGGGLAIAAAVLLAYIPRLPSPHSPSGLGLTSGGVRITASTNRRLRMFATTQIAFSFVLLAAAATLLSALVALQSANTGYDMRHVLAVDIPTAGTGIRDAQEMATYQQMTKRIGELPGVEGVAMGTIVPWRDANRLSTGFQFAVDGYTPANGEEHPHARLRVVAPRFFSVLGIPLLAGRDFTDADRATSEHVVIVSQSLAQRMFPNGEALNRKFWWTEAVFGTPEPRRIVGIVADVDDENVVPVPTLTVYHPVQQLRAAGRLFVHTTGDPYLLLPSLTRVIRELSASQPVERAATLADIRATVLAPERLNAFVLTGFAGVALLIAIVGVAGVLAFSVSARTREFGVRLAVGSAPRQLLVRVLVDGLLIVGIGIAAGAAGGYIFKQMAAGRLGDVPLPSIPILGAAVFLAGAAVLASLVPAARASRVDVVQALRSE